MSELVDGLVSGTSAERRGGSSPLLGTKLWSGGGTATRGTANPRQCEFESHPDLHTGLPSSRGPGYGPLKAGTRVRIPLGAPTSLLWIALASIRLVTALGMLVLGTAGGSIAHAGPLLCSAALEYDLSG